MYVPLCETVSEYEIKSLLRSHRVGVRLVSKSLHYYIASHPTSYFYPAHSLFFYSAPGRIRTCDRRIRSPLLCPLSYGRIRLMYSEFSPPGSSRKPQWRQCDSASVRNARSQRAVHGLGQAAVHTLDDVGVGVEGDENAGVAEEFLNILWVLARHEEYCSAGVA